jgi:hypothetical protein
MSNSKKSGTTKTETSSAKSARPSTKGFQAELQAKVDAENAKGFRGIEVDPTPNENYTVKGVTSNKPTPETDVDAAGTAREATNTKLSGIESVKREKDIAAENAAHTRKVKRGEN